MPGLTQLHELIADHLDDEDEPESVLVGSKPTAAAGSMPNRLVGILDGCLRHRVAYDEATARAQRTRAAA